MSARRYRIRRMAGPEGEDDVPVSRRSRAPSGGRDGGGDLRCRRRWHRLPSGATERTALTAPDRTRRESVTADAVLVGVTVIWGSTFVVNQLVAQGEAPPLLFLLLRFSIAAVVLFPLARRRPRTPGLLGDSLTVGGLTAIGIGFQLAGQVYTTASKAAFITGLSVPLTAPVALLVTRKRPSPENLTGLALATAGFAVLAWPREFSGINAGDLLVLVTAISYAYVVVRLSESSGRHDVRWFAAGQTTCAAVVALLLRLAVQPFLGRPEALFRAEARLPNVDARFLGLLLWMSIAATVVTFLLMTWAQARMTATHAAVIYALEPVFAALLAALFLGERLSGHELWGGALVLLGILVSEIPLSRT